MQKSINRQSGFAIGTILLAVVLIAAIVSAIAIASRGTSQQGNREQARVQASTVISQGVNISNGFQRLVGAGATAGTITASGADATTTPATNGGSNADNTIRCTTDQTRGTTVYSCLFGSGAASDQRVPRQALPSGSTNPVGTDGSANQRHYFYNRGGAIGETAIGAGSAIIYVRGIDQEVCRQINQQVNSTSLNAGIPVVAASQSAALANAATGENTALAFDNNGPDAATNTPDTASWVEGCMNTNTGAAPVFTYFRQL